MARLHNVVLSTQKHVDKERNLEKFPEKALPYCVADTEWTIVANCF